MNFIGKTFGTFLSCNMQYVLMHLDKIVDISKMTFAKYFI